MKKTHIVAVWFWFGVSIVLGACTQAPTPQPPANAATESDAETRPPNRTAAEDSENFGPAAFRTYQSYLARGDSNKAIAMLQADPRWISFRADDKITPLHYAAQVGDVETVQWLLNNGADVNAVAYNDFTPLHLAENPKVVALILQKKPDLTLQSLGRTPLQEAADNLVNPGRADQREAWHEIIQFMLDAGAEYDIITAIHLNDLQRVKTILKDSPDFANRFRRNSPLRTAAELGHLEICRYLIGEHHVDVNDFEGGAGYPIIKSALAHPDVVRLLIDNGADLKTRITWRGGRTGVWFIGDEATALHYAAGDGVPETVDLLIDNGVDIFAHSLPGPQKTNYQTALEVAALYGKAGNASAILKHPKFSQADGQLRQALLDKCLLIGAHPFSPMLLRGQERPQLIKVLLEHGAHPNVTEDGLNAMLIVVRTIHPNHEKENREVRDIVASLIGHGATVDLFSAVAIGDESQVARLLKENPESANVRHPDGYPALHFAVDMNYPQIVAALLKAGCDVDIRNKNDGAGYLEQTALHSAAFWGRYDIAKLLIEAGANVNALTDRRNTPLHEAAQCGNVKVLQLLLESGAKPDAVDRDGQTPLDWCHELNDKNAVEVEKIIRAHITDNGK